MLAAIVTLALPAVLVRAARRGRTGEAAEHPAPADPVRRPMLFNHGLGGGIYLWERREERETGHRAITRVGKGNRTHQA